MLRAQVAGTDSSVLPPGIVRIDSLLADSTHSMGGRPTKSPGLAMLFSALVPGAGQVYNESYLKVPVIVGFGVYFGAEWIHFNNLTRQYRDLYAASITDTTTSGNENYRRSREFYKDQRDAFTWYFAILYLLNIADAFVDASLFNFNVSDDLSIRLLPEQEVRALRPVSGVRIQITF